MIVIKKKEPKWCPIVLYYVLEINIFIEVKKGNRRGGLLNGRML